MDIYSIVVETHCNCRQRKNIVMENYFVTAVWALGIVGYSWVFPPAAAEALTHGLAAVVKQSFQITHYPEQDPLYASPGETVSLSCGVESHFDCCTWSHLHKVNS